MTPAGLPAELHNKTTWRERVLNARRRVPVATRRRDAGHIFAKCLAHPSVRRAQTLFIYVATEYETDTRALIDHCVSSGQTVLVPLIRSRVEMSAVRFPGWTAMAAGVLGILSPPAAAATWTAAVDVTVVPGLAFGLDGGRIGYGAGYYDRWLAAHAHTETIALCAESQLFPRVPVAAHDVPMATIMTETRTLRFINARPFST